MKRQKHLLRKAPFNHMSMDGSGSIRPAASVAAIWTYTEATNNARDRAISMPVTSVPKLSDASVIRTVMARSPLNGGRVSVEKPEAMTVGAPTRAGVCITAFKHALDAFFLVARCVHE